MRRNRGTRLDVREQVRYPVSSQHVDAVAFFSFYHSSSRVSPLRKWFLRWECSDDVLVRASQRQIWLRIYSSETRLMLNQSAHISRSGCSAADFNLPHCYERKTYVYISGTDALRWNDVTRGSSAVLSGSNFAFILSSSFPESFSGRSRSCDNKLNAYPRMNNRK